MFKHRLTLYSLGLALLVTTQSTSALFEHSPINAKQAGYITLGIATLCGIYAFFSWATTPSNTQLIDANKQLIDKARHDIDAINILLENASYTYDAPLSEPLLYELAQRYFCVNTHSFYSTKDTLDAVYQQLRKGISQLETRLSQLEKSHKDVSSQQTIRELIKKLEPLIAKYERLTSELSLNDAYFRLYIHEAELLKKYGRELTLYNQYHSDAGAIKEGLKAIMLAPRGAHTPDFPHVEYIETIKKDHEILLHNIGLCGGRYPARVGAAQTLAQILEYIPLLILHDITLYHVYTHELHMRQQQQIEREKAAQAKREAEAAQRKAQALEQQVLQTQRENKALKQQTAELESQADELERQSQWQANVLREELQRNAMLERMVNQAPC